MESQKIDTDGNESHLKENMLLRFRVGPFKFSVPAVEVEGIIVPPSLTRIPLNPPHSKGVFMYHGHLTSAISLRSKFGLPDHDDQNLGQLVLGLVSIGMVGLWVDEVYETVDSTELEWRDMPDFIPHEAFDSFAAKGDSVIMATTIQKLYDVPAEQVSAMLAGVRQSYDLPADVAPVATESFEAPEQGDGTDDSFGELTSAEDQPGAGSTVESSTGSAAGGPSTNGDSVLENRADPASGTFSRLPGGSNAPGGGPSAATTGGSTGSESPRGVASSRSSVVNLSSRRPGASSTGRAGPQNRSAGPGAAGAPGNYAAARATRGREGAGGISGRSTTYRSGGSSSPGGFTGGTYSGSVSRFTSGSGQQNPYGRTSAYESGDSYLSDDQRDARPGAGRWWLMALLVLLLLLLAFWFWPSSHNQGVISTIPNQNYQERYRFSEQDTSSTVKTKPRTEPVAAPTERQISEPSVDTSASETSIDSSQEGGPVAESVTNSAGTGDAREIYRLEGEEVTVTVERGSAQPGPEPEAVTRTGDITPAYTEFVHTVVKGDTLWDIAAKYLKNPFRYPELARLSQIKNPDLIYPGDTVRIRKKN